MGVILSRSEALSLGQTIGAMLTAVIDAQAESARTTIEFIRDVAFRPEDPSGELVMQSFRYRKLDENQEEKEFVIEVPLLSMVEIPMVNVKKARFEFGYDITDTREVDSEAGGATVSRGRIRGRFLRRRPSSSAPGTRKETGSLDVTIELEQGSPTIGVERILEMLEIASNDAKVEDTDG
ncbi:MAG: DUF2589 domain-containing protein [bacterium]|nr:DUF2589 domain-containing protein [bacterium]